MKHSPLTNIRIVAGAIQQLGIDYAFVGGAVVELLLDNPDLTSLRPTDDVDVVLRVLTRPPYAKVEAQLRKLGFSNDTRENAPLCRWVYGKVTVDVMPENGEFLGLNTKWFAEAIDGASIHRLDGVQVPVISAMAFLAAKLAAYNDRGDRDYYGSKDLEDVITVIDGRAGIIEELSAADEKMRLFVSNQISQLIEEQDLMDALSGMLPGDSASQKRLPELKERLKEIARHGSM